MNDIEKILKENGIIIGINTCDKIGFFGTNIDLTDEPKGNLRAMRFYPDSIRCGPDDFSDATVAISYPNDMKLLKRVYKQLRKISCMAFATHIVGAVIKGDVMPVNATE